MIRMSQLRTLSFCEQRIFLGGAALWSQSHDQRTRKTHKLLHLKMRRVIETRSAKRHRISRPIFAGLCIQHDAKNPSVDQLPKGHLLPAISHGNVLHRNRSVAAHRRRKACRHRSKNAHDVVSHGREAVDFWLLSPGTPRSKDATKHTGTRPALSKRSRSLHCNW